MTAKQNCYSDSLNKDDKSAPLRCQNDMGSPNH